MSNRKFLMGFISVLTIFSILFAPVIECFGYETYPSKSVPLRLNMSFYEDICLLLHILPPIDLDTGFR